MGREVDWHVTEFSIIMPVLDAELTIARAVSSIQRQADPDWELIIVDDGSSDGTADAVAPFLDDHRITFHERPHRGVAAARNDGAARATGRFLGFLDSDDEVTPRWLSDFRECITATGDSAGYVSCAYQFAGRAYPPRRQSDLAPEPYLSLAGTFALRRDVFDEVGGYDEALKQSENWEMAARVLGRCQERDLVIVSTNQPNMIRHRDKTRSQQRQRDEDRAAAMLHLHEKYSRDGVLHPRRQQFLLGAAVNFVRAGQLKTARRAFYRNLRAYPSVKNLGRIACFEIPPVRRRLWDSRTFAVALTDG